MPERVSAGFRQRVVRRAVLLCCALLLLPLISGCMEELQTSRPAALQPSPPLTMPTPVGQQSTPTLTQQQAPVVASDSSATATVEAITATPVVSPSATERRATTVAVADAAVSDTPGQGLPPEDTVIVPATRAALSNEERWRAQQQDRQVFDGLRQYVTSGSDLWWYDPINQQHLRLGSFQGAFEAQAAFALLGRGEALEVPYQVNNRYGITSLSPAILDRIAAAGYDEWIETYVLLTPNISPR